MKLTAYYGKAIRVHPGNLRDMTDAVLATYYHGISTDDAPQHELCPPGKDSWCFVIHAEVHPALTARMLAPPLSPVVTPHIKEVYNSLVHTKLLKRCLKGKSQNPNEALHSVIWGKCPKTGFVALRRVVAATSAGVAEFNCGVELNMRSLFGVMTLCQAHIW